MHSSFQNKMSQVYSLYIPSSSHFPPLSSFFSSPPLLFLITTIAASPFISSQFNSPPSISPSLYELVNPLDFPLLPPLPIILERERMRPSTTTTTSKKKKRRREKKINFVRPLTNHRLTKAMRKEFAQARCLQVAQSQLFGAHDEIKMSTSRMRLKETQEEHMSINVLNREELVAHSLQYSSDKLLSLASLTRIKGQLRYLKGLMVSNQKTQQEQFCLSSMTEHIDNCDKSLIATGESGSLSETGDELCPICHEDLCNPKMMFPCGHVICCKCCLQMIEKAAYLQKWVMCPTCRQHTDLEHIAYVDERKDKCGSIGFSNTFQVKDIPESSIRVNGSYGTKIEAVTRRILLIARSDQEAKVIVFSSWNDVLDVLAHALDANSVTYVRMKGGRKSHEAIAKFKGQQSGEQGNAEIEERSNSNPIRVLLILIQHGANGLNILEAQHVILVEPLLNPAAEAQAISRVHRVGQEKRTFVHRFLVKNTVEESIYKLNRSRSVSSVIGTRSKHQDKPTLTIQDMECLFPMTTPDENREGTEVLGGGFSHLPPAVAAGLAAERRLREFQNNTT